MSNKKLELQVLFTAVDKFLRPVKAITQGAGEASKALKATKDQLKALNAASAQIETFKKVDRDAAITANAFKGVQERIAGIKAELAKLPPSVQQTGKTWKQFTAERMSEYMRLEGSHGAAMKRMGAEWKALKATAGDSGGATARKAAELATALHAATKEAEALKTKHASLMGTQQQLFSQLKAGGIDTSRLADEHRRLASATVAATNASRQQSAALEVENQKMKRLFIARAEYNKAMARRTEFAGTGIGLTAAGAAMGAPVINAVRQYSSFEDAMLGVQRQVQGVGEVGSASYKAIATEIKHLGRELPIATTQIAAMYSAAARMEVPREGLRDFTRTVAMMATAFDAVPDEIAEAMGKVAKNFRIPVTEIRGLADTINYLDDNAISKASDIIDVLNRTSGVAASVAITDKATAALASTLLTLGDRTESAGTAINAILQRFAASEKGSKKFLAAMQEIGLSAKEVQAGMQTDAQGTLFKVIAAIQRLPAQKRTGVMVELVGMEHSDTLAKLTANTEEWRRQIALANNAAAQGSMEKEFVKRTNAMSASWERFKNSFFDVNTESGAALRGSLTSLMEGLGGVLDRIADFMRENPGLTSALVHLAAVTAIVVAGMGALTLAMAAVIGPFAMARYGMALFGINGVSLVAVLGKVGLAARWLGSIVSVVGRALLLNPIGLAITAIAAAAFLIYKNWEPIKGFFLGLWAEIKTAFDGGLLGVSTLLANWSPLGLFYKAFAAVMSWFGIELPGKFTEFGAMMLKGLVSGILSGIGWVKNAVLSVADSAVGWFKEKLGIRSPSRVFTEIGGYTMEGLEHGIQRGREGPLSAVMDAARRLTAAGAAITLGIAGPAVAASAPGAPSAPAIAAQEGPLTPALDLANRLKASTAGVEVVAGDTPGQAITFDTRPPLAAAPSRAPVVQTVAPVIHIYAAPGMDAEAIGRVVEEKLAKTQRDAAARARSRLTDPE